MSDEPTTGELSRPMDNAVVSPRSRRIGGVGAGASVWSNRSTIVLRF